MVNPIPSKHILYFDVLEALHNQGCPVCRLGLRAVSRYLDALSYEGINDSRSRTELRAARGFCHQHAWQFAGEVRDGLGTAIIYRDVIGELLRILPGDGEYGPWRPAQSGLVLRHRSPVGLAGRLAPQQECPACCLLERSCLRYLDTLLSHLGDEVFRGEYLASDGLCLPHLVAGLRRLRRARQQEFLAQAFGRRMAAADATAVVEAMVGKEGATPLRRREDALTGQTRDVAVEQEPLRVEHDAGQEDCPVCLTVAHAMDRWLAQLATASAVTDAQQQDRSTAASLCNAHVWRLLRVAGASDVAGLLRPQAPAVASLLQSYARHTDAEAGWRRLLAPLRRLRRGETDPALTATIERGRCPACEVQAAMEQQAILAVLETLEREPLLGELRGAPQLCLPHARLGLDLSSSPEQAVDLIAGQVETLRVLRWELCEYIRKQDYRFRHEPLRAEVDAPWRAIAQLAGARSSPVRSPTAPMADL